MAFSLDVNLIAKISNLNALKQQLAGITVGGGAGGPKGAAGAVAIPKITGFSKSAAEASKNVQKLNDNLSKTKAVTTNTVSATKAAGGALNQFGSQAFLAGKRYLSFVAATAVPIAIIRGLRTAISSVIEFDKSLVGLSQILGTTVEEVGGLGDFMLELSVKTGTSQEEISGITKTLAQAGLRGKELTTTLSTLAKVPLVATFSSVTTATEGVIATINQFRDEALSAEQVLDRISNVSRNFAIDSDDLAQGLTRAGGAFAAVGGNFNELLAVLTTIRSVTRESASTVGTAVKTITTRLARVKTVDFLESIGVQVRDAEGDILGFVDVIRNLEGAFKAANKQQKAQIAEALGGFRQISRVFAVLRAPDVLEDALVKANEAEGTFSKQAEQGLQSLEAQIGQLVGEFNKLIQSLREPVFAPLIEAALIFGKSLNTVLTFVSPLLPALIGIGATAIGISAVALAFTKLAGAIKAVTALRLAGLASLGKLGGVGAIGAKGAAAGPAGQIAPIAGVAAGAAGAKAAASATKSFTTSMVVARGAVNKLGQSQLGQAAIVGVVSVGLGFLADKAEEAGLATTSFILDLVATTAQFAIIASFLSGTKLTGLASSIFNLKNAANAASIALGILTSPITLAAAAVALPIVGAAKAQADVENIFDQVSEQIGKIKVEESVQSVETAIGKLGFDIARGLEAAEQNFDIDAGAGLSLGNVGSFIENASSQLVNLLGEGELAAVSSSEISELIKSSLQENEGVVKSIINNALLTGTTDLAQTLKDSLSKFFPKGLKFEGAIENEIVKGAVKVFGGASALAAAEIKAAATRRAKVEEDIAKKQKEIFAELNKIQIPAQLSSQLQALSNAVGQTAQELDNNIKTFEDFTGSIGRLDVPLGDIDLSTVAGAGLIQAGRTPEMFGGETPALRAQINRSQDVLDVFDIGLDFAEKLVQLQAAGSKLKGEKPLADVRLPFDDINQFINDELGQLENVSDEQRDRISRAFQGLGTEIAAGGGSIETTLFDVDEILSKALDGVELKKDSGFADRAAQILINAVGPERAALTAKFADVVAEQAGNLFKGAQFAIQRQLATLQFRFQDIQGPKEAFDALKQTLNEASAEGVGINKTFRSTGIAINDLISSATNIDAIEQANRRNNEQLEKVLTITKKLNAEQDPAKIDELQSALLNAQSGLVATKGSVEAFSVGLSEASKVAGDALEEAKEKLAAQPGAFNERQVRQAEAKLANINEKLAEGARILRDGQKEAFTITLQLTQLQQSAAQRSATALLQAAEALEQAASILPKLDPDKDIFKNITTIKTDNLTVITQRTSDTGLALLPEERPFTREERQQRETVALGGQDVSELISVIQGVLTNVENTRKLFGGLGIQRGFGAVTETPSVLQDISLLDNDQLKELVQLTKEQIKATASPKDLAAIAALGESVFNKNIESVIEAIAANEAVDLTALLKTTPQAEQLAEARETQTELGVKAEVDSEGIKNAITTSFGTVATDIGKASLDLGSSGSAGDLTKAAQDLSAIKDLVDDTRPPTTPSTIEGGAQGPEPIGPERIDLGPIEEESENVVVSFNDAANAAGGLPGPLGILANALALAATAIPVPDEIRVATAQPAVQAQARDLAQEPIPDNINASLAKTTSESEILATSMAKTGQEAQDTGAFLKSLQTQLNDTILAIRPLIDAAGTLSPSFAALSAAISQLDVAQEADLLKSLLNETGTSFKDTVTNGRLLALNLERTGQIVKTTGGFFETRQDQIRDTEEPGFFDPFETPKRPATQELPEDIKDATDEVSKELETVAKAAGGIPPAFAFIVQALTASAVAIPDPEAIDAPVIPTLETDRLQAGVNDIQSATQKAKISVDDLATSNQVAATNIIRSTENLNALRETLPGVETAPVAIEPPNVEGINSALGQLETSVDDAKTKMGEISNIQIPVLTPEVDDAKRQLRDFGNQVEKTKDDITGERTGIVSRGEGGRQRQFTRGIFGDELFGDFSPGGFAGGGFGPSDISRPLEDAGGTKLTDASNKIVTASELDTQAAQSNSLSSDAIRLAADGYRIGSETFRNGVEAINAIIDPRQEARPEQRPPEGKIGQDKDNLVQQVVSSNEQTVSAINELGSKLDTISTNVQEQTSADTTRAEQGEGTEIEGLGDISDASNSNAEALKENSSQLTDLAGELSETTSALGEGLQVQLESIQNLKLDVTGLEGAVERLKPEFEAVAKKAAKEVISIALKQLAAAAGSAESESSINNAIPD